MRLKLAKEKESEGLTHVATTRKILRVLSEPLLCERCGRRFLVDRSLSPAFVFTLLQFLRRLGFGMT